MDRVDVLYGLLSEFPPCQEKIEQLFQEYDFSKEELSKVAIKITEDCGYEYSDLLNPEDNYVTVDTMHSNHLIENLSILLKHGLDPNMEVGDESAMDNLIWVDAPDVGACAYRLLLEHGADPNFRPSDDPSETIFEYIATEIHLDEHDEIYLSKVQKLLVFIGYGATFSNGNIPLKIQNNHDIRIFKNFECYDYYINEDRTWMMYIYDKETKEIVAEY